MADDAGIAAIEDLRGQPSSMRGTLIGTFITSTSIVIGSDSVVVDDNGGFLQEAEKTCRPSGGSIATIQGEYGMPLVSGRSSAFLYNEFRRACSDLYNRKKPLSLKKQTETLMEALHLELKTNLVNIPLQKLERIAKNANHVNFVSVSGYIKDVPHVYVRELRVNKSGNGQWEVTTHDVQTLSPEPCGARFHGDAKVANRLMQGFAPNVIPQSEFLREEVIAGIVANRSRDCSSFSEEIAWDLFQTAVRLTNNHGPDILIPRGRVGGTLYCWSITSAGVAARCKNAKQ
jgi:hypothetical protein